MLGELVGLQVGNLQGLEATLFACWANLQGCRLATYRVWRLHYLHVGRSCRAVGWQPTGFGGYIICMLGELVGLQVGNLQGLEATLFACWTNSWGCRLATYRVWRLHYLHVGRTCRAVGWQPTGFGCYIICMLDELVGLQVGNLQGLEATLFACWANLQGCRLATYRVWRLHYLHVGRTRGAVGWQPTGFGGYIICMLGELVGLQVGNLQGLEATLFACWTNSWGCRLATYRVWRLHDLHVGRTRGAVGWQPTGFGGYIICMLDELVGLQVGNLQGVEATLFACWANLQGCRLATYRVWRLHYLHVGRSCRAVGWQPTGCGGYIICMLGELVGLQVGNLQGLEATLFACLANLQGCRLATYRVWRLHYFACWANLQGCRLATCRVWRLHYLHVGRTRRAVGWQPTGFGGYTICMFGKLVGLQVGNLHGLEATLFACWANLQGCKLATYRVWRLHCLHVGQTCRAVSWQPTGFGGYIICMLGELLGLQVGNLQGLEATLFCMLGELVGLQVCNPQGLEATLFAFWANLYGCRLATYRVWRLHYLYVGRTCRAVGWQPTGFGGYIICMLGELLGQPTGFGGSFAGWANLQGCRLATYRVWRLRYLHVGRTCRAVGWQPTGFGGCIICMLGGLVGLQVGNLQGLEATLFACWANLQACRLATYRVWRLQYLHVGRSCRAVGWQPTGCGGYIICMLGELVGLWVGNLQGLEATLFACWAKLQGCRLATTGFGGYIICMLGELVGLQVGNLQGLEATLFACWANFQGCRLATYRVWRMHYLHVGRTCRAAGWQPTGFGDYSICMLGEVVGLQVGNLQGVEATLFACWANLQGCRLATYRVWRLHYLHVGRSCRAVGWQPTGCGGYIICMLGELVGLQVGNLRGLEAAEFSCWANLQGCRLATYRVWRLHYLHVGRTCRAVGWQPTGCGGYIICMLGEVVGLQVGNLRGLEAALFACWANLQGCRLATYRAWRLHYLHVGRTCRAVGWQPTGCGGCIICMLGELVGLQVGNLQGLEATLFACWANFQGCRLATYRVWRMHYLHVGRTCRAAGWQPTGCGGYIICMLGELLGLQVGNLQGVEATLFACWANLQGCRLATYRVWRLHYLHVGRSCRAVGWQPTGCGGYIICMLGEVVRLQVGNLRGLEAAEFSCWANLQGCRLATYRVWRLHYLHVGRTCRAVGWQPTGCGGYIICMLGEVVGLQVGNLRGLEAALFACWASLQGCRLATYRAWRLHYLHVATYGVWRLLHVGRTCRAAGWQPTGCGGYIICMLGEVVGLQVGNLQGVEAAWANLQGCRLATYRVWRLHYLHVGRTCRAVGWQPTGFGGYIICILGEVVGLQVGNLRGLEAALFACWANLQGCRLATYRVWRLHYLHVGRSCRAVGWQPTGFGGCIICMLGELLGLQVGNLQGLEATLFACWANFQGCRLATYRVWRMHYLHVGRTCRVVGWQPTGFGGYIFCMLGELLGLQVGNPQGLEATLFCMLGELVGLQVCNPQGLEATLFAFWANLYGCRLATYRVWRLHYLYVGRTCRAVGWQPTGFGGYIICMLGELLGQPTGFGGSFAGWANLQGCRLATYRVWRLYYLHVGRSCRAAGWQPTGCGGYVICMLGELVGLQVGNLQGLEAALFACWADLQGCRLATYRVWRLHYLHVGRTCRAVGWQPTGFGDYSICMLGEVVGLQAGNLRGLEAFACWANLQGCRLATYRVWRLHYLHVGRTCRAAGWQPTGCGGYIICMLGELVGLQVGNLQGVEATLFACWAKLQGCRLATYRVWRLHYLHVGRTQGCRLATQGVWRLHNFHVGRTCRAVGWQPTGCGGCIICMLGELVGLQVGNLQGVAATLFACWAKLQGCRLATYGVWRLHYLHVGRTCRAVGWQPTGRGGYIICMLGELVGLQVGNLQGVEAALFACWANLQGCRLATYRVWRLHYLHVGRSCTAVGWPPTGFGDYSIFMLGELVGLQVGNLQGVEATLFACWANLQGCRLAT